MKPKVFLTRKLSDKVINKLKDQFDLTIDYEDRKLSEDEIITRAKGHDGIICLLNDSISKKVIESFSGLKIISNFGVGFNNIDVKYATEKGIMVTNTPGVLDHTTAELAFALILAVSRRVAEGDRFVRDDKWNTGWEVELFQGFDLRNKTLGIIGFGRIGQVLAKKTLGFEMKILYHNRNRLDQAIEKNYGARYVDKETLLKESDIISLHTPFTAETRHIITEKELLVMKKTAILINTARGEVVDEKALYTALVNKTIWGAGLDVFEEEPKLTQGLIDLDNVVLLPHIGSASVETRETMGLMVADNMIAGLTGKTPPNLVNKGVLNIINNGISF